MQKIIIKVCGMRDPENIREIESLDVDFIGFIFYNGSPRFVGNNDESTKVICSCKKQKVGVFVNEPIEYILDKAEKYKLDFLQLHGIESPELCLQLQNKGYQVIKAFSISSAEDFVNTQNYPDCCNYFLFDTKCDSHGGSGKRFDWSLIEEYKGGTPFLLSGGLTFDCVDDLRLINHPAFAGIDLNSGFEKSIAIKDAEKINEFVKKLTTMNF